MSADIDLSEQSAKELRRVAYSTHSLGPHARAILSEVDNGE